MEKSLVVLFNKNKNTFQSCGSSVCGLDFSHRCLSLSYDYRVGDRYVVLTFSAEFRLS